MALPIAPGPTFDTGAPTPLFQTPARSAAVSQYAAAPGGQKFLVLEPQRSGGEPLTFVVDWPGRLEQR